MVWFQCEDCGENLKKPKLQNHFRICSANKLSCIDCGVIFNRESVQAHTQCVSEQEKYGPKGEGKGNSNTEAKGKPPTNQNCDVDLSVGLSNRPPWSCSLCNVKATSRETLLLHSEGKKHRSKSRAIQASNKLNQTIEPFPNGHTSVNKAGDSIPSKEQPKNGDLQSEEIHDNGEVVELHNSFNERGNVQDGAPDSNKSPCIEEEKSSKKRKRKGDKSSLLDSANADNKQDQTGKKESDLSETKERKSDTKGLPRVTTMKERKEKSGKKIKQTVCEFVQAAPDNEHRVVANCQRDDQIDGAVENANGSAKQSSNLPVKWKKIIKSVLKSSPDGSLRMKKLEKQVVPLVMKDLESAGVCADESRVKDELKNKVLSSSRFVVDCKIVRLA